MKTFRQIYYCLPETIQTNFRKKLIELSGISIATFYKYLGERSSIPKLTKREIFELLNIYVNEAINVLEDIKENISIKDLFTEPVTDGVEV
ncbi:MAG: hypothetical protein KAT68_00580 [Bacteroidales bacterium]|nr:hypothetical protein [Bacteroidales bacterium]